MNRQTNGLIYREAVRSDVPEIVALLADDVLGQGRESTDQTTYFKAFERIGREGGNTIIVGADAKGAVLATYQIMFFSGLSLKATRRAEIESVRVATSLRGKGVGHAMFQDAEKRARAAGCGLIQLTSNATRVEALSFYEAVGFTASHIGFKRYLDDA